MKILTILLLLFLQLIKDQKNKKNIMASAFIKIRDKIEALYSIKSALHSKASNEKRKLRNSEIRQLETIKREMRDLDKASKILSAFRDEHFVQFSIDYGANKNRALE